MSKAIDAAEKNSEGKSFQAELKEQDGLYLYTIKMETEKGISTHIIDSFTGIAFKNICSHPRRDES